MAAMMHLQQAAVKGLAGSAARAAAGSVRARGVQHVLRASMASSVAASRIADDARRSRAAWAQQQRFRTPGPKIPPKQVASTEFTELVRNFLDPADLYQALGNIGVDFFTGVPDSLLKDFCAYVTANSPSDKHIITANEGLAISTAAGYYMATKRIPLVYMQNSGLGNSVNPIMSLCHPDVYSIPMLMMIGWRGEPGKKDEPQHVVQGENTPGLLTSMGVPFQVLPDYIEGAEKVLQTAKKHLQSSSGPYALLVKRATFERYDLDPTDELYPLNREAALQAILPCLHDKDVVVGTTGMLSRELFEERVRLGDTHERDFLTVGSMGHATSISLGISLAKPNRSVYCIDGDGACLMHMGAMGTIGAYAGRNYKHILINNAAHDSVGGQPTLQAHLPAFSFGDIAKASGYKEVFHASTAEEVADRMADLAASDGPSLLEVRVRPGGHRKNLGRPTRSPIENRDDFMRHLDRV